MAQALERLVIVMRESPRANDVHDSLAAVAAAVAGLLREPERLDAGVEQSAIAESITLRGRMLARAVDWVEIRPGASAEALTALARALASDDLPVPSGREVRVAMVPVPEPATTRPSTGAGKPVAPPALRDEDEPHDEDLERLMAAVAGAAEVRDWATAIARGRELLDYAALEPGARRTRIIRARRELSRELLEELTEHALRHPEDQHATAEILSRIGPDGHEVMVSFVAGSESFAARRFLHEQLGRTPDALPLVLPLLERGTAWQARHAAGILGRLGDERAVQPLARALDHPDEGVRAEAARALARFDDPAARTALMGALRHASATTRLAAAQAVGNAELLALAPSVMGALREEQDRTVRRAFATAAARLGTVEGLEELVRMALARRRLLRGGFPLEVRLDVVGGLAAAATPAARRCLDRIAREGDRPVQEAADQALSVRRQ